MEISKNVIEKIKNEHIIPRPKWQFILLHALLWFTVAVSVLIGSALLSLLLREIFLDEWEALPRIGGNFVRILLLLAPYFWVFCIFLILFLSYKIFRATSEGYRYEPFWVVGATIFISLVLGYGSYASGLSNVIEEKTREYIQPYNVLQEQREKLFVVPERGILGGMVVKNISPSNFLFQDVSGKQWNVLFVSNLPHKDIVIIKPQTPVLLIGHQADESSFEAHHIKIWKRGDVKFFQKHFERILIPLPY